MISAGHWLRQLRPSAKRSRSTMPLAISLAVTWIILLPPVYGSNIFVHGRVTNLIGQDRSIPDKNRSWIVLGAMWPDIRSCFRDEYGIDFCGYPSPLQAADSAPYHFDGNRIADGIDLVNAGLFEAFGVLSALQINPQVPLTDAERAKAALALVRWGEAIHTLQDFYAHSDYIEMQMSADSSGYFTFFSSPGTIPLWNGCDVPEDAAIVSCGFRKFWPLFSGNSGTVRILRDGGLQFQVFRST